MLPARVPDKYIADRMDIFECWHNQAKKRCCVSRKKSGFLIGYRLALNVLRSYLFFRLFQWFDTWFEKIFLWIIIIIQPKRKQSTLQQRRNPGTQTRPKKTVKLWKFCATSMNFVVVQNQFRWRTNRRGNNEQKFKHVFSLVYSSLVHLNAMSKINYNLITADQTIKWINQKITNNLHPLVTVCLEASSNGLFLIFGEKENDLSVFSSYQLMN